MLAAADAGQAVVASILGLGAAGVAGGVIAMAWSLHVHQLHLAARFARREAAGPADSTLPVPAMNGNGHATSAAGATATTGATSAKDGNGAARPPGPAPSSAIEGPDSVITGEQARYRVRRSATQQVVAWAAGGGAVSQASDPAHPDDLLLVADRPGDLMVSVRLREGLAERRETKAVTAVPNPAEAAPVIASRLLLQDWPVITVAVLAVGFAGALVALGSFAAGDFIALVTPLAALLAVVAVTRGGAGRPSRLTAKPGDHAGRPRRTRPPAPGAPPGIE